MLERDDGTQTVVRVEGSPAALDAYQAGTLPKGARLAIQTEGRSEVEKHLAKARLPARIRITPTGVRRSG